MRRSEATEYIEVDGSDARRTHLVLGFDRMANGVAEIQALSQALVSQVLLYELDFQGRSPSHCQVQLAPSLELIWPQVNQLHQATGKGEQGLDTVSGRQ